MFTLKSWRWLYDIMSIKADLYYRKSVLLFIKFYLPKRKKTALLLGSNGIRG